MYTTDWITGVSFTILTVSYFFPQTVCLPEPCWAADVSKNAAVPTSNSLPVLKSLDSAGGCTSTLHLAYCDKIICNLFWGENLTDSDALTKFFKGKVLLALQPHKDRFNMQRNPKLDRPAKLWLDNRCLADGFSERSNVAMGIHLNKPQQQYSAVRTTVLKCNTKQKKKTNKETTRKPKQLAPSTLCEEAPKTTKTSLHWEWLCAEQQGVQTSR